MKILRRFMPAAFALTALAFVVTGALPAFGGTDMYVKVQVRDENGRPVGSSEVRLRMQTPNGQNMHIVKMDQEGKGTIFVTGQSTRNCWQATTRMRGTGEECFDPKDQPKEMTFTLPGYI